MTDLEMRAWRDHAVADGNDPEEVVRLLHEHTRKLACCVGFGASIACKEVRPPAAMLGRLHEIPGPLCPKCEEGLLGHQAYHIDVEEHRRFAAFCDGRPEGKSLARQVAAREHAACPWAARGVECYHAMNEPYQGPG
jgi:hypothetical protein